jgi:S-adenosylmethionine:tRNA ribosyltransferase-isomerase
MLKSGKQSSKLFIHPPFKFAMVDALITNFHLPQSSLLMMVSAFTSQPNSPFVFEKFSQSQIGQAYQHAIQNDYRFFSFGDAMLIV